MLPFLAVGFLLRFLLSRRALLESGLGTKWLPLILEGEVCTRGAHRLPPPLSFKDFQLLQLRKGLAQFPQQIVRATLLFEMPQRRHQDRRLPPRRLGGIGIDPRGKVFLRFLAKKQICNQKCNASTKNQD
ncbi:hypothetical protein D3C87_1482350 [compost metagenome]